MKPWIGGLMLAVTLAGAPVQRDNPKGTRLEQHAWDEAERLLQPDTVVVLPLGAALKEHGRHLKLRNDLTLAEYFADRVAAASAVVVTPPLTYHFYPAFLEYPGSTSLSLETARDLTVQVALSLARYGPRRFYVLNTGLSTTRALQPAADALAREGILLHFTDFGGHTERIAARLKQQEGGSHADEIETSLMLYIDPASVNMSRAEKDYTPGRGGRGFTRQRGGAGIYSPTGAWGDPTLATREKGQYITEQLVTTMLQDIETLRRATPPSPRPQPVAPRSAPVSPTRNSPTQVLECLPGVERDIKLVETAFNASWSNRDYERLGALWTEQGDLIHGDGSIEKGREVITANRRDQFKTREYKTARHSLTFGLIRCITSDVAVVDGRWDLQDVTDSAGKTLPRADGFATLVLRSGETWKIEAYRYNTKPGAPTSPTLLKKPGYPDKR